MSRLVVISPPLKGSARELGTRWVTIGRAEGNAFQIVAPSISGRHCEVRLRGNELQVRDLRSTNGTFIAGQRITEGALQSGQTLRLGEVELLLEITAPAPAAPPAETVPPPTLVPGGGRKIFRVLFVDDSLAFLETIAELFGVWSRNEWEIHTVPSADQALARLEQKLFDLIVLDIGLPLLDGAQLLGIIHQRHPGAKKVILTGQDDEHRRADCLASGADLFLIKPVNSEELTSVFNMLGELVQWPARDGFSGSLGEIGLASVIQVECQEGNSSVVEVRHPQVEGEIYIEAGAVVHAVAGRLTGEKAFHQLVSLTQGDFCLKPFRAPSQRTLRGPWESLLAETSRVQDTGSFSTSEDETMLIVKPPPENKIAPEPEPAPPVPQPPPPVPPPAPPEPEPELILPAPAPVLTAAAPAAVEPPPVPVSPMPDLPAAEPPGRKIRPVIADMNIIALDEMVEADTTVIRSAPEEKSPADG